jgi:hypothetical protein
MSFLFAFLHGEQVLVGLLLAGIAVLLGVPLLLYLWLWKTRLSELHLALAYFMLVAALCVGLAVRPSDPTSVLTLAAFSISFILTLPWSPLVGWFVSEFRSSVISDREFSVGMLIGAGINSVVLYFIAAKMRRLIN